MFNPVRLHPELRTNCIQPHSHQGRIYFFILSEADFLLAASSSFYDNFYDIQQSKSIIFVSFMMIFSSLWIFFSFSCRSGLCKKCTKSNCGMLDGISFLEFQMNLRILN